MVEEKNARVPIVGIGASAGGIEALEALFRAMPIDVGAAFVVITHLNPKRESALASILQRFTEMPVVVANDDVTPEGLSQTPVVKRGLGAAVEAPPHGGATNDPAGDRREAEAPGEGRL